MNDALKEGSIEWPDIPGSFYLGELVDPATGKSTGQPFLLDSRDLTTHAVVLGMTGSGKTGFCIDLIEEAVLDRIPVLAVDIKGDISNLGLLFPELRPEDFRPWLTGSEQNEDMAREIAQRWQSGLKRSGIEPERLRRLKETSEFTLFTPGWGKIRPISILRALQNPGLKWDTHPEAIQARVTHTVTAILTLLGINADPLTSREHILLSQILMEAWKREEPLDLAELIRRVQRPPFEQVGVLDLESFFPGRDRMKLALALNHLVASPAFSRWLKGETLDLDRMMWTEDGRPRITVLYTAHLSPDERMFFLTLFLQEVVQWVLRQPGTDDIRALLYIDELFGLMPPVAKPPTKELLLLLLKQARAFGLGLILATQNPIDLDYRGLSNAGIWAIGRLQTERDLDRLADGLSTLQQSGSLNLNIDELLDRIAGLPKRVFLFHNVHAEVNPVFIHTRWAMSYLRGPIGVEELGRLVQAGERAPVETAPRSFEKSHVSGVVSKLKQPPAVHPDIPVRFAVTDPDTALMPHLLANIRIFISDTQSNVETEYQGTVALPLTTDNVSFEEGVLFEVDRLELTDTPPIDVHFHPLPARWNRPDSYKSTQKKLVQYLYQNYRIYIPYHRKLKMYGRPDEPVEAFISRVRARIREAMNEEIDRVAERYQKKIDRLVNRMRREQIELADDEARLASLKQERTVRIGESLVGFLMGRRSTRAASSIMVKQRMIRRAALAVEESKEEIQRLQEAIESLKKALEEETETIRVRFEQMMDQIEWKALKPLKRDIWVDEPVLVWLPEDLKGVALEEAFRPPEMTA